MSLSTLQNKSVFINVASPINTLKIDFNTEYFNTINDFFEAQFIKEFMTFIPIYFF